jgi:hypothetical protein
MREDPSVDPVGEKSLIISTNGDRFKVEKIYSEKEEEFQRFL